MSNVAIIGAGGHGRVVADALMSQGIRVLGYLDPALGIGTEVGGLTVLGDDSWLEDNSEVAVAVGVGATKDLGPRTRIFDSIRGNRIVGCVHSSAVVGTSTKIHATAQIFAGCIVNHSSFIGRNVVMYTGSIVEHDCVVGEHSYLSPRTTLCGGVKVGASVFIGAGAVVLPNVTIGDGATIAAGAVVTVNVDENSTVMGVPAKVVDSQQ